jgi:hypothetical protein
MTALMASSGTWLCPTELDRTRLLDMEARIARPRALMYAALAVGLASTIPWVGWWPMIPVTLQLVIYAALRPLITRARGPSTSSPPPSSARRCSWAPASPSAAGPGSPGIALMLLPLVTLPARFSARGV